MSVGTGIRRGLALNDVVLLSASGHAERVSFRDPGLVAMSWWLQCQVFTSVCETSISTLTYKKKRKAVRKELIRTSDGSDSAWTRYLANRQSLGRISEGRHTLVYKPTTTISTG